MNLRRSPSRAFTLGLLLLLFRPRPVGANPHGMTVTSGSATVINSGPILTVSAANNTHLNWQSFNIAANETTLFQQPSSSSIVWNTIGGQSPSQIYGSLQANGIVVLMNGSGFYFGPNAYVKAAGLVVSTAQGGPVETSAGAGWQFTGPPPAAHIINYGQINAGAGGFVYLLGASIDNEGGLTAPAGNIGLCAGQTVLLSNRADGRGLSAQVTLPAGSVDNHGRLTADAGTILASAQVVNQNGLVQADSAGTVNGVVELYAADSLSLGANSVMRADGQAGGLSSGGTITLKSGGGFADTPGSLISAAGGTAGGNGGTVEISAGEMPDIQTEIIGQAGNGAGGTLILDPANIVIGDSGGGSAGSGSVGAGSSSGTLNLNVNSAFTGFSQIDLQATLNITLSAYALWDLGASTGVAAPGCRLKLEAGNNITLGSGSAILAPDGWSVTLEAGRNFSAPADTVTSGAGAITFSGSAGLQAGDGNITLLAGQSVTVNSGYVRTVNGGNIDVSAVAGSVNTGNKASGFDFRPTGSGYVVDPDLGGISTAAGGNVTINAGADITSYLPVAGGVQTDAGTGCFGPAPGYVTLTAGQDVAGHFVLADGVGRITAGDDAGLATKPLALSLISGGWTVTAGHDILLQEVRNPNGIFNDLGYGSSSLRNYFDYSPNAYTILNAGDGVELLGTALPRYNDSFDANIPCIYPPILEITAGAGGVTLGNNVILFPSAQGSLNITTTDGGALTSSENGSDLAQLIVSDSGKGQYQAAGDFGLADHAAVPVHLNDEQTIELNISGDMDNIYLGVPECANITIGGDMINCRFDGQNLQAGDVTSINVAGAIENRSEFTSLTDATAPDFSALAVAYSPLTGSLATPGSLTSLASLFYYDPATQTLTFQGRMTTDEFQALLNLTVPVYAANGQPVLEANRNPVTQTVPFVSPAVLQSLYAASQDIPSDPDSGYRLGGAGAFNITAASLDLGATAGIVSEGPAENTALANYFTRGADINVTLTGDLDMFSTTISCLNGGNINVQAGGTVNLGSTYFSGNDAFPRGIFSTDEGNVTVVAGGDIDINGSRIAAYDGGNVTVESLYGNVEVGAGGQGSATVEEFYVDPLTRVPASYTTTIPGSGILATTFPVSLNPSFPTSQNAVGNILVETPQGNVTSTSAGIVQIPLNGSSGNSGGVTVLAGYELRDANGQAVSAATGQPAVQELSASAPAANAPGRLVVINGDQIQVSASVWPTLLALLGLPANDSQVIEINVSANKTGFEDAVTGDGAGVANFNFMSLVSAAKNIDVTGGGVIGANVQLKATGSIQGSIVARNNLDISALQNVTVSAFAAGDAHVQAGDTLKGTLIGLSGIDVSGISIEAALLTPNVTASGNVTGSKIGFTPGTAARSASQGDAMDSVAKTVATGISAGGGDDAPPRPGSQPKLKRFAGRVTVLTSAKTN